MSKPKLGKTAQRRARKKEREASAASTPAPDTPSVADSTPEPQTPSAAGIADAIEPDANNPLQPTEPDYDDPIQDVPDIDDFGLPTDDPLLAQFAGIFAKFRDEDKTAPELQESDKPEVFYDDDDNIQGEDEEEETQKKLSKKARKQASKLSIAELKAIVRKPEVVEWTDTSAHDPKLLVNIKSARNVVPVPNHWSLKREYLSSKRGIEKPGFSLPKFIAETGISNMRDAVLEKQAEASLKQRQRERVQPKMGKLDIDYQKLYEAFFRRQTKPSLTRYGEVYYEGKEYETNLRHLRPGELSDELKEALNMPPGAPPPWLINQQKIGPPPSYPAVKIHGLNAPPPPGASWGFHPGGYGKPPQDTQGRPLWGGDIFGLGDMETDKEKDDASKLTEVQPVDRTLWGELQPFQEEEEEEEEENEEEGDDDDGDGDAEKSGLETPYSGIETPSGITSTVPTDFGTHSMAEEFNLRKQRRGTETEESHHLRSAGQVLQEKNIRAEGFFGGERAYNLNGLQQQQQRSNGPVLGERDDRGRKRKVDDVDVSMDVDALERDDKMSKDELKRQYETQRTQQGGGGWKGVVDQEDLSQMIAEESAKRQKRDQERERKGRR